MYELSPCFAPTVFSFLYFSFPNVLLILLLVVFILFQLDLVHLVPFVHKFVNLYTCVLLSVYVTSYNLKLVVLMDDPVKSEIMGGLKVATQILVENFLQKKWSQLVNLVRMVRFLLLAMALL